MARHRQNKKKEGNVCRSSGLENYEVSGAVADCMLGFSSCLLILGPDSFAVLFLVSTTSADVIEDSRMRGYASNAIANCNGSRGVSILQELR